MQKSLKMYIKIIEDYVMLSFRCVCEDLQSSVPMISKYVISNHNELCVWPQEVYVV